jgi:hypothetical protein
MDAKIKATIWKMVTDSIFFSRPIFKPAKADLRFAHL